MTHYRCRAHSSSCINYVKWMFACLLQEYDSFYLSLTILYGKLQFFILLKNWNVWHLSYFVWGEDKHAPLGRYNTRCHSAVGQVTVVSWTHWLKNSHSPLTCSDVLFSFYHFASLDAAEFWSWLFSSELLDLLDSRQRKICFALLL